MADDIFRDNSTQIPVQSGLRMNEVLVPLRTSWGAIWAGTMVALGMVTMFTLFGFFVGADIYSPGTAQPFGGITIWSMAWYLVTIGFSMFAGAWATAALSGNPDRRRAVLHGIATWGLAVVATLLVTAIGVWGAAREGIALLVNGSAAVSNVGLTAQGTADSLVQFTGTVWGGVFLGLITAYFGALAGRTRTVAVEAQTVTAERPRRAA